jgi:hypothetical protein
MKPIKNRFKGYLLPSHPSPSALQPEKTTRVRLGQCSLRYNKNFSVWNKIAEKCRQSGRNYMNNMNPCVQLAGNHTPSSSRIIAFKRRCIKKWHKYTRKCVWQLGSLSLGQSGNPLTWKIIGTVHKLRSPKFVDLDKITVLYLQLLIWDQ